MVKRRKSVSFQTNQGTKLKNAIDAVISSNSSDFGIIESDPINGLEISSLRGSGDDVISFVRFEPGLLTNFVCSEPTTKKILLKYWLRLLQAVVDESILLSIQDHSRLTFESASEPGLQLSVSIQENDLDFKAYSGTLSHTCKAVLPTDGLKAMIPEMNKDGSAQLVSVDITLTETKIVIGTRDWVFKSSTETGENTGVASGQRYHVEFKCSHVDTLMKASSLAEQCSFALLASGEIMFQFPFEEGSLVYIKRPDAVSTH